MIYHYDLSMITPTRRLQYVGFYGWKTYAFGLLFALSTLILPQLIHCIPNGGLTLTPILFLTLLASYRYGMQVGLLTAILSPLANFALFGMPHAELLPTLIVKGILLAVVAGYAVRKFRRTSILMLICVITIAHVSGLLVDWIIAGSFSAALNDSITSAPGMLLQIIGGYLLIHFVFKK